MPSKIQTKATSDGGRSVKVTDKKEAALIDWLGTHLVKLTKTKAGVITLKVKTPKGLRNAVAGDVIIRYGTLRNGGTVSYVVEKA